MKPKERRLDDDRCTGHERCHLADGHDGACCPLGEGVCGGRR